ncbi:MAG: phosphate transporter substrate-binding protein PstS [Pseudonocardiales bacterium]|nr:phosphate transporter substrate-binding protein PstS [Pseudonocardiales bacterium]
MKLYRAGVIAGLIAGVVALAACSSTKNSGSSSTTPAGGASTTGSSSSSTVDCATGTLNAEGSTAQTNAMTQWINDYQKKCGGATINYNPTGSGAGVKNFNAGQVDFGGSDSALDPTKGEVAAAQKRCGAPAYDLPMVVGPIGVAFKVNGVDTLTMTPDVIAKIFAGKISTWNDPAIKALNSSANLPATKITVFFRSDSSGTTQNFEKYLKATAPTVFTATPDKDSSKSGWVGQGKAKSQGVAQAISTTEGSIGYVEYSFAVQDNLSVAAVDNGGGPVKLSKDTASAALSSAKVTGTGGDLTLKLDYATKAAGAYPIILVTYEIACSKYTDAAKGKLVKSFLSYTATGGQAALPGLGYAPLPSDLQSKVTQSIAGIS